MPDTLLWRRALAIAFPLMLAESVDSILWMIDAYFVSRLGDAAIAGVGVGGYMGQLTFAVGSLYYMGALVLVAQAVGAGKRDAASASAGEALSASLLLSIPVVAAMYIVAPQFAAAIAGDQVSSDVKTLSVDFYRARLIGMPFTYAGLVLGAVYRGAGKTRPVFYSTLVSTLVNGVLDPILIFGLAGSPRLGVAGAGYATSIASIAYFASMHVMAPRTVGFSVRPRIPSRYAAAATRIGVPALVERLVFVGGNLAYIGSVARCGEEALAAHTIGIRLESIAYLPLFAIAESSAALAGQEMGAGRVGESKRAGWEVAKLNMTVGAASMTFIIGVSSILPHLFTSNPTVAGLARLYLIIAGLTEPTLGVVTALAMAIRGAGNTTIPTVMNLAGLYLLRVLPAGLLPKAMPPGFCVVGAWLAMGIDLAGRASLFAFVYRRYFERITGRVV